MYLLKAVSINAHQVAYLAFFFFFFIYFIKTITWFLNICCLFHEAGYHILLLCNELLFFTTLMFHLNYKITSNTINIKNLQRWCNQQFLSFHFYHVIPRKILRYKKAYIFPSNSYGFFGSYMIIWIAEESVISEYSFINLYYFMYLEEWSQYRLVHHHGKKKVQQT